MQWFVFVVSADVCQAGVDLGGTNMAGHIVVSVNSVGVVLGHWVFHDIAVLRLKKKLIWRKTSTQKKKIQKNVLRF